jgi:hypothetical protein
MKPNANAAATYGDIVLSNYPVEVTVRQLESRLAQPDEPANKKYIIDFIHHRLHRRYLTPLQKIPKEFKSGFLMMASACLLIESLQQFYLGKNDTRRQSEDAFKAFFERVEREENLFPGFAADSHNFYTNIRCGILHQAETKGGYRILRRGVLFDPQQKTVNADAFIKSLERSLKNYTDKLRLPEGDPDLWKNAVNKVKYICANCQT